MKLDSDYAVRLAILGALGGDTTKSYDSVYEVDLAILAATQAGSGPDIQDVDLLPEASLHSGEFYRLNSNKKVYVATLNEQQEWVWVEIGTGGEIVPLIQGANITISENVISAQVENVINDEQVAENRTWSSSKIDEELQSIAGTANSEFDGKTTEDFTFVTELPVSGEEGQQVIIKGENVDILYKYVSDVWVEQTPDANILYFDTLNEALYSYITAEHQFAPISIVNTIVVGKNLNSNAALKNVKEPGVYNVLQRTSSTSKGEYTKKWTLTVEGVDYDEYELTDSVYQKLQSNYTIQKRTWSSSRQTNDGWSSFSTYYAGEIKDSTTSKYYTWSSNKLNTELGAKQDSLTAGQNITIDANSYISADGYVYDETDGSIATKYLNTDDEQNIYIATNTASGEGAFAKGYGTTATGVGNHAEGGATQATGRQCAHAEGLMTVASGMNTHAEGAFASSSSGSKWYTTAAGNKSHAEGEGTYAGGTASHTEGSMTQTLNGAEHAQGILNLSHKVSDNKFNAGNTLHSIGIGHYYSSDPSTLYRTNALEIMQNGDQYIIGVGGYEGTDTKVQNASIKTVQEVINSKADAADLNSYATIAYVTGELAGKADVADLNSYATIAYVTGELVGKQDILTEGAHIDITNNVISVEYEVATTADIEALFAEPAPVGPANDELWYTTSDGEIILIGGGGSGSGSGSGSGGGWPQVLSNTYEDGKGVVKFADDLTEIPIRGFSFKQTLTTIEIPNSVTSIGERAFEYCIYLTSVTIPDSVTSIEINTFDNCRGLTSVTIPNSVTSIGERAFAYCTGLTSIEIPNSVTSIENSAFDACSGLTSIIYNGTMTEWNNIELSEGWNDYVPATVVHCTDGDINL